MYNKKMWKKLPGFTLIELLIVIIIVAILAVIALPMYLTAVEKARLSEGVSIIGILRQAQLRYYLEHSKYTDSFDDLDVGVELVNQRYFQNSQTLNPAVYNDQALIASTVRNSNNYSGGAAYTLNIDVQGDIWCINNDNFCAKLGLPVTNP